MLRKCSDVVARMVRVARDYGVLRQEPNPNPLPSGKGNRTWKGDNCDPNLRYFAIATE